MFNFSLYKAGLRKAMPIGLTYAILATVLSTGLPLLHISSIANSQIGFRVYAPIGWSDVSIFAHLALGVAPLMCLHLFGFLHDRAGSDFFHAAPHKRESIFLSKLTAILTWIVPIIWGSTLLSSAIFSTSPHISMINMYPILRNLVGLTAAVLLVMAATLIAMASTGTTFSTIMLTAMILFVPRALFALVILFFSEIVWVVSGVNFGIFGNHSLNIIISSLVDHGGNSWQTQPWPSILYTATLALLYFGGALFIFKRRRSEQAGFAGANPVSQSIIRIVIAFAITAPFLFPVIFGTWNMTGAETIATVVGSIGGAIFAVLVYEAISLRRFPKGREWRGLAIGLAVVALLNVGSMGAMTISRNIILDRNITTENVTAVSVRFPNQRWGHLPSYSELQAVDISLTDSELIAVLVASLDEYTAANRIGNRGRSWHENLRSHYRYGNESRYRWRGNDVLVTFTVDGRDVQRRLVPITAHRNSIHDSMARSEEFQNAYLNLPANPEHFWMNSEWRWCDESEEQIFLPALESSQIREVYEILREEVRGLPASVWLSVYRVDGWWCCCDFAANSYQQGFVHYGVIRARGMSSGREYESAFPITSATPRAAARLNELRAAMPAE
ncbi:MAG: hypothetical protein FWB93_02890 [Oscillospiraceae bacterium]|nr:hypothetical protein [Oscillospiraceae bacterium]